MGTKIWGPLGWMTLHSISAIYPESPTLAERTLLEEFMNCFRDTISCPYCKTHFTNMFNRYRSTHPEWSSNRQTLFIFICRAHNTVNRRLDKPLYTTVSECIETLKNATKMTSASEFRKAYLDYLTKNWGRQPDSEGFMMMSSVRKMIKINEEYFNTRPLDYSTLQIKDDNVIEFIQEDSRKYRATTNVPDPIIYRNLKIGFRNGSFVRK